MDGLKWIKLVVLAALTACFLLQVKDWLVKFLAGKTVATVQTEHHEWLKFPVMAVCPGFKRGTYDKAGNQYFVSPLSYLPGGVVTDVNIIREWWNNVTFGLEEVMSEITVQGQELDVGELLIGVDGTVGNPDLTVTEVWASFGKCYIFNFIREARPFDAIKISFRHDHAKDIGM